MSACRKRILAIGLCMLGTTVATPASSADGIDPDADRILKSMSTYLAGTKAFSVNAEVALEIVMRDGQKLQLMRSHKLIVQRPSRFRIDVKGVVADAELIFDGKTLTLYSRGRNAYMQRDVSGTIDDGIRAYEFETGLSAPGADLLFADPYAILSEGILSGVYLGTAYVDGIECHHLAFREDQFDWQMWVQAGDRPLPMRYVITSTWQTGAPQMEISMRDWNTGPKIADNQFAFSVPDGVKKLDAMPAEDIDDVADAKEDRQ